jgi:hypothetical protein
MNRRDTLKRIVLASGSLVALPSWANGWSRETLADNGSMFSVTEQDTLASVADTIIPAGTAIGALSVGVDKFLQKLIEKCYEQSVQDNVKVQLNGLETTAQSTHAKSFVTCDQSQRQALLMKLSTSGNQNERDFFNLMKSETIRGFNTSKEVMSTYQHYKVAPGHYYGCVDVKQ